MKTVLKMLAGLLAGGLIGLLIGGLIVVVFTDTTFSEYLDKYYSISLSEGAAVFFVAVASSILSFAILVPVHEFGHLVCGLLSGYKFVSFRIFNLTLLKENGKFRIKRFAVAGTGGQCLLSPPEMSIEKIPTFWYNFGGILANIIILLIVLPFLFLDLNPFVAEALGVFAAVDAIMILTNSIPMKAGGVGNDGYNLCLLQKDNKGKTGIINQLRANALIQQGVRPKDMPDQLFALPTDIDYSNALEVSMPLMYSGRLIDMMHYEEALECLEKMYSHKDEIMQLYLKEIACELAFLYLRTGNISKAEELLDESLRKYIVHYSKMMSSKERLLIAMTLYLDKNEPKAQEMYASFKSHVNDYLLQGEAIGDLALIEDMLGQIK